MPVLTASVALCTRDGARFVGEQLRSILGGTVRPDQIVVVDDASTDDTMAIVERELAEARGIEVVLRRNAEPLGVTANFESAIALCTSDVVVLCDQDDRWRPDRLAHALERFAADDGTLLVHADAALIDGEGAPLGATLFEHLEVSDGERAAERAGRAFDVFLRRNLVTGATAAVRRDLAERARPFPAGWVHDEWMAIVAAATGRVVLDDRIDIEYRLHGGNQIGVARPTLRRKLARVLGADPGRNRALAERSRILVQRLTELDAAPAVLDLAHQKARVESARADLPRFRAARLPGVLRLLASGAYPRFASRGRLDALRDLLQPR